MSTRWWTFVTWALVAASAVFWGLRLFVKPAPLAAGTQVAATGPVARGDLTRLLGIDAPPPAPAAAAEAPADARFQLIGVVATKAGNASGEGVALIAIDGKPARAFRVGAVVDGQTIVKSVAARGVALGPRDGNSVVNLPLAPLPPASTGTLPGAMDGAAIPGQAGQPIAPPRFVPLPQQPMQQQVPQPTARRLTPPQPQQLTQQQIQQQIQQQAQTNPGEGPGQSTGQGQPQPQPQQSPQLR